eukprot:GHVO01036813.1.p2 GENE.GHVO01036813.1~~GHVO01036813.1.p2  ORF type:complete len:151 (-),score=13.37 GHVO01036813.1:1009-1461(-)
MDKGDFVSYHNDNTGTDHRCVIIRKDYDNSLSEVFDLDKYEFNLVNDGRLTCMPKPEPAAVALPKCIALHCGFGKCGKDTHECCHCDNGRKRLNAEPKPDSKEAGVCPDCKGRKYHDAMGSWDQMTMCATCNGTGKEPPKAPEPSTDKGE